MVHIVLYQPEIPQNTGNIARTCAATGAHLHLIEPLGFAIDDRKLKRAGLDYWHLLPITRYESWAAFCQTHPADHCYYFSTKAKQNYAAADLTADELYLVFGPETRGLPEEMLEQHPGRALRIPMRGQARSLNLSNSVAVAVYEALRQRDFAGLLTAGPSPADGPG